LFYEAQLLANHGAIARAYFLHQISLEECGKIEMITAATTSILRGETIDMKRLAKAFRQHESKNKSNAYFLPTSADGNSAMESHDTAAAAAAFSAVRDEFHVESNTLKNESMYVSYDGKFSSPRDVIDKEKLNSINQRNSEFLSLTKPKIDLLKRWNQDLTIATAEISEMFLALGMDKLKPGAHAEFRAFREDLEGKLVALSEARSAKES
jgi:AbiV family abortive infection protein